MTTMVVLHDGATEAVESNAAVIGRRPCVTASMLRDHFHLPLYTVAKKFSMCTTAFKKMCRRLDIPKWPHRQLRGIDKRIAALKAELAYTTTGDRKQFLSGISCLQEEKARLAQGLASAESVSDPSNSRSPSPQDVVCPSGTLPSPTVLEECDSDSDECSAAEEEEHENMEVDCEGTPNMAAITEKELRESFHLPLHTVAKRFGMCTTAFKKMCRRFGIAKWPHRQLRGIDKKIASLRAELTYSTGDVTGFRSHLKRLEEEKARLSRTPLSVDSAIDSAPAPECAGGAPSAEVSPRVAPARLADEARPGGAPPPAQSNSRMGIRNLLCDEEERDEDDDDDGALDEGRDTPPIFDSSRTSSAAPAAEAPQPGAGAGAPSVAITEGLLQEHFHLPLQVVAKKFGMCTTAFKKLCRRFGVAKWPHRQLRGIDKKIAALRAELAYSTGDRDVCRRSLQVLEDEKARLSRVAAAPTPPATAPRIASPRVTSPRSAAAGELPPASPSPFPHAAGESPRRALAAARPCGSEGLSAGEGGGSALDLLAMVAGVKEELDHTAAAAAAAAAEPGPPRERRLALPPCLAAPSPAGCGGGGWPGSAAAAVFLSIGGGRPPAGLFDPTLSSGCGGAAERGGQSYPPAQRTL